MDSRILHFSILEYYRSVYFRILLKVRLGLIFFCSRCPITITVFANVLAFLYIILVRLKCHLFIYFIFITHTTHCEDIQHIYLYIQRRQIVNHRNQVPLKRRFI